MSAQQDGQPDFLGRIIRAAGRREVAPEGVRERVLAAAAGALAAKLAANRARQRRRVAWQLAAAAVALVAVGLGLTTLESSSALPVALSDQFVGDAAFRAADGDSWAALVRDRKLLAGSEVRTRHGGRVGLVLAQGASLRLDEDTHVRLAGPARVEIVSGTVYVDSRSASDVIDVVTPLSVTRDVGTQFEVRYRDGEQRVRIREGAVAVVMGKAEYHGQAGEQLLLSPGGRVQRAAISRDDGSWEWVQLVVRAPDIDNRPLMELLDWVGRETGLAVRYESPAVESLARSTILHGSIRNLAPLPAARTMLATTDLDLVILGDGVLLVRGRDRGDETL